MGNQLVHVYIPEKYADSMIPIQITNLMKKNKLWTNTDQPTPLKKGYIILTGEIAGERLLFRKLQERRLQKFCVECDDFIKAKNLDKCMIRREYLPM